MVKAYTKRETASWSLFSKKRIAFLFGWNAINRGGTAGVNKALVPGRIARRRVLFYIYNDKNI